jgi:pimeloyl-ACP methyl ester carboxylesterase
VFLRRVIVVLLAAIWGVMTPAAASATSARARTSGCGAAVERVSDATEGAPVLLVHGFAGRPSDFRHRLTDERPSMQATLRELDGVVVYTFDYSAQSLEWVTDRAIAPALGRAIVCLAERQDAPVTVVAHSMGGLAARAAQGEVVDGVAVADAVARVITVGTPFRGAQLLGFADGAAGDVVTSVIRTALRACDEAPGPPGPPGRSFCGLLGATETKAVQGMIPGSDELSSLPPWAEGLRILPAAAEIEVGIDGPFGFSEQFAIGDFAVSVDSATADVSPGARRFVAACSASLFGLADAIDDSPCSHANELANRRIIRHVRETVQRAT